MSVNVKLGNNTINGVNVVRLEDATTSGTYHDFSLGSGTPGPILLKAIRFTSSNSSTYYSKIIYTDDTSNDAVDFYKNDGTVVKGNNVVFKVRKSTDNGTTWSNWEALSVGTTNYPGTNLWEIGFFDANGNQLYDAGNRPGIAEFNKGINLSIYGGVPRFVFENINTNTEIQLKSNALFYMYPTSTYWCSYNIEVCGEED